METNKLNIQAMQDTTFQFSLGVGCLTYLVLLLKRSFPYSDFNRGNEEAKDFLFYKT
jgi:hypothetical protein